MKTDFKTKLMGVLYRFIKVRDEITLAIKDDGAGTYEDLLFGYGFTKRVNDMEEVYYTIMYKEAKKLYNLLFRSKVEEREEITLDFPKPIM